MADTSPAQTMAQRVVFSANHFRFPTSSAASPAAADHTAPCMPLRPQKTRYPAMLPMQRITAFSPAEASTAPMAMGCKLPPIPAALSRKPPMA